MRCQKRINANWHVPRKGEHESMRHHERPARINVPPWKGECKSTTHHRKGTWTRANAELGARHRNRAGANSRRHHEWTQQRRIGRLERHIPCLGDLHLAAPKSVRRHHQPQINHAPWPIHLTSYPTIEELFCFHLEAHTEDAASWEM